MNEKETKSLLEPYENPQWNPGPLDELAEVVRKNNDKLLEEKEKAQHLGGAASRAIIGVAIVLIIAAVLALTL